MALYERLRPVLFRVPPETAHDLGKRALRLAGWRGPTRAATRYVYRYRHPKLRVEAFDVSFPNPVGVAAGFDKNAEVTHGLAAIGFGFVEVGTVTPYAQAGNPQPRLFRLPEDRALINRMGFNGHGADIVSRRLETGGVPKVPLGINVGKMNSSDQREAIEDYRRAFRRLASHADYAVVNVSCPNTDDAFDESSPAHIAEVFETLQDENDEDVPLLVKIGPDGSEDSYRELVRLVDRYDLDGFVATNTSTDREGLESPKRREWGGLSGRPLAEPSTAVIRLLARESDKPIVGVGGVDSAEAAYRKIRAGASLVQLYTGLIYRGPTIAREINRGLVERLERDGFDAVSEAVGVDRDTPVEAEPASSEPRPEQ